MLGIGIIYIRKNRNQVIFQVRNREHIKNILLPIINKYGLYTLIDTNIFNEAITLMDNVNLSFKQKEEELTKNKLQLKPQNFHENIIWSKLSHS